MASIKNSNYLQHRARVLTAAAKTDDAPPVMNVGNLLRISKLKEDTDTYMRTAKHNVELLVSVNNKMRTGGVLNTFPSELQHQNSNMTMKYLLLRTLEENNHKFGERILQAKSVLETRAYAEEATVKKRAKADEPFVLPTKILEKYGSQINLSKTKVSLRKLFRPLIYFDLEIHGLKPLGRIIVELYTEAAPQVVYELTKTCSEIANDRLHFIRIFPSLWFEGEIDLNADSSATKRIEYDMRALDHGSAGILSFARSNLKGFRHGKLSFTISFKPLSILNGQRVAFGKVVRGLKILDYIQHYGSKNGKLKKEVHTIDCGLIR